MRKSAWRRRLKSISAMILLTLGNGCALHPDTSNARSAISWNQMALTILLRTNRGRTQRALKTEVRMNSNQDHTLPWREGSPMIFAVRVCSSGINTR